MLGKDEYTLGSWLPDLHQGDVMDMQPITMTLVDPVEPHLAEIIIRVLTAAMPSGFPRMDGSSLSSLFGTVRVEQLDHAGNAIETFELVEAFPVSIDFGSLDYSSSDMTTVTIVWEYKSIKMSASRLIGDGEDIFLDTFLDPCRPTAETGQFKDPVTGEVGPAVAFNFAQGVG